MATNEEILEHNRQLALMERIESPYMRALIREKNRYIQQVADVYAIEGILPEALDNQHHLNIYDISSRYNTIALKAFAKESQFNFKNQGLEFKQTDFEKWLAVLIAEWLATETGRAARQTSNTTTRDIKDAVTKSLQDGLLPRIDIVKNILKVKGFSPFRAATIAQTETHNAAIHANKESAKRLSRSTGISLLKKWIPTQDSRTRDPHRAMASHPAIDMDSLFNVGGARMDRPGDPRGGASNVIRCRCSLSYKKQ